MNNQGESEIATRCGGREVTHAAVEMHTHIDAYIHGTAKRKAQAVLLVFVA